MRVKNQILFQADAGSAKGLGRIDLAGTLKNAPGLPADRLRILDGFAAVYILKGSGWYKDEHGPQRSVRAGDLILAFPGLRHSYGPDAGQGWDEIYICFSGPIFDLWRQEGILDPAQPLLALRPIQAWAERLKRCVTAPGLGQLCRIQDFLADALSGQASPPPSPAAWFEEACQNLGQSGQGHAGLPRLAASLGLSYESFRKKFKAAAGLSPAKYAEKRRLEQAGALLGQYNFSNQQMAEMLGFCDEFYFSRRFKAFFGVSPKAFRQRRN